MTDAARQSFRAFRASDRHELAHQILGAIEPMLEAEPYAELSVDRIVDAAGISRSSFYNYFEDKGDLLQAMGARVLAELEASIRGWWDFPATATHADLVAIFASMGETFERHRGLMTAVIEASPGDARVRDEFDRVVTAGAASVADYIRRGQREGFIDPSLDADRTGTWITLMVERGLYQLHSPTSGYDRTRLIDALATVIEKTLQP